MNAIEATRWVLNFFELGAVVAGVLAWKKIKHTYWQWLLVYLMIVLVNELVGKYLNHIHLSGINQQLYRYTAPFRFLLLLYVLMKPLGQQVKNIAKLLFVLYIVLFLAEQFVLPIAYFKTSMLSLLVGYVSLLVLCMAYLAKMIQSDAILQFKTDMHFWLAVGLLLFYVIFMPFHTARTSLSNHYPDVFLVYWYVQMAAACIMYVCFSILFVWGKPS
jgi:hypothetical protein